MSTAVMPAALLFAALGLVLPLAPRRAWTVSVVALFATLGAFVLLSAPRFGPAVSSWGLWISVMATAASVQLVRRIGFLVALVLSLNAGLWVGAAVSLSGSRADLLEALPFLLTALPASWAVRRQAFVPVRVVSSWVIAIAVLAVTLHLLPVTPGYLPDHME